MRLITTRPIVKLPTAKVAKAAAAVAPAAVASATAARDFGRRGRPVVFMLRPFQGLCGLQGKQCSVFAPKGQRDSGRVFNPWASCFEKMRPEGGARENWSAVLTYCWMIPRWSGVT